MSHRCTPMMGDCGLRGAIAQVTLSERENSAFGDHVRNPLGAVPMLELHGRRLIERTVILRRQGRTDVDQASLTGGFVAGTQITMADDLGRAVAPLGQRIRVDRSVE